jgi:hypothetical protein
MIATYLQRGCQRQCFGVRTSASQPDGAATGITFMNASTPWISPP